MTYIRFWNHVDPDSNPFQIFVARDQVNTVAKRPPPLDMTIMAWNLQTLGGGIGRSPLREQDEIDAIARVIHTVRPDLCVIIEVMERGRPPAEPRTYEPRGWYIPRGIKRLKDIATAAEQVAANMVPVMSDPEFDRDREFAGFLYGLRIGNYENAVGPKLLANLQKNLNSYSQNEGTARLLVSENIVLDHIKRAFDLTRQNAEASFETLVTSQVRACQTLTDDMSFEDHLKSEKTVAELYEEFHCETWYQLPSTPFVVGLDDDEVRSIAIRHELATHIQQNFHNRLLIEFAKRVLDQANPGDDDLVTLKTLFEQSLGRLQQSDADVLRRKAIYNEYREAYDKAKDKSKHSGVLEFLRIYDSLKKLDGGDHYSAWPARHDIAKDNVNGDRSDLRLEGDAIDTSILYTEGETYGVLYRHKSSFGTNRVALTGVRRPAGYTKRAPFIFQFTFMNEVMYLVAWHAPSDSINNQGARTEDFLTCGKMLQEVAGIAKRPVFTVGDFNVNTAGDQSRITNSKANLTPAGFFDALYGEENAASRSYFWQRLTSLRMKVQAADDANAVFINNLGLGLKASAFDWIADYRPISGFDVIVNWESVIPVPSMLASENEAKLFNAFRYESKNGIFVNQIDAPPDGRTWFDVFGTGVQGSLGNIEADLAKHANANTQAVALGASLLARTRRISDHLPVAVRYGVRMAPSTDDAPDARGKAVAEDGIKVPQSDSTDDPSGKDGYWNIGKGDCLFHAVLHMIERSQQTFTVDDLRYMAFPEGAELPAIDADGNEAAHPTLLERIQALRNHVANEVATNLHRYVGFIALEDLETVVAQLRTMQSWDHIGGDMAPLAIANLMGRQFCIRNAAVEHVQTVTPAEILFDALNEDEHYINYNGFNHYW